MEPYTPFHKWSGSQKILFRVLAIYLLLYICSNQFVTTIIFDPIWGFIVPFVGKYILGLSQELKSVMSGSGDGIFNYVSVFTYFLFAIIGAVVWTFLDKNRANYSNLMDWLVTLIRYYVAFQMILYGVAKLSTMQFGEISHSRLLQTYGDSSPMRLLWTFMSASTGYQIFTGFAEVLGGIFLLWKRTTTIGALTVFGVMANVMALNFFYDVPVKLLSSHLVFMSILLILLDGKRLLNLFFKNEATAPAVHRELISYPIFLKVKNGLKVLFLIAIGAGFLYYASTIDEMRGITKDGPDLRGVYEVSKFSKDGKDLPLTKDEPLAWQFMTIDRPGFITTHTANNQRKRFKYDVDSTLQYLAIGQGSDTLFYDTLFVKRNDDSQFFLEGSLQGDTIAVEMIKKSFDDFLLTNRGFHWVSEVPFNR